MIYDQCVSILPPQSFKDLINFSPTFPQVAAVVQCMVSAHPHLATERLSIKDLPDFQAVYIDETAKVVPAKDSSEETFVQVGRFRNDAPYEDPFDTEEPIPSTLDILPIPDDYEPTTLKVLTNMMRERREDVKEPTLHLRSIAHIQDGSMKVLEEAQDFIEKYHEEHPSSPKVGVYSLRILRVAYELMKEPSIRQECLISGHLALILKIMNVEPKSPALQVAGIEAFFQLMGSYGIDETLPVPPNCERGKNVSRLSRNVIRTTIVSLASAPDPSCDLRTLFRGLRCIVNWYHTSIIKRLAM